MEYLLNIRTFILFILCIVVSFAKSNWTTEDCFELGFNKANLLCTSCVQLTRFGLDMLHQQCLACCQATNEKDVSKKYPTAVLEMCECKMSHYPQIEAFIKSDRPKQFPGLTMKHIRLADPVIKLMDSNGHVDQELAIGKWNTDSVEEFFRTHMEDVENVL